jgi:hypothetical protein
VLDWPSEPFSGELELVGARGSPPPLSPVTDRGGPPVSVARGRGTERAARVNALWAEFVSGPAQFIRDEIRFLLFCHRFL